LSERQVFHRPFGWESIGAVDGREPLDFLSNNSGRKRTYSLKRF